MSDLEVDSKSPSVQAANEHVDQDKSRKGWVKFEDESTQTNVPLPQVSSSTEPSGSSANSTNASHAAVLKTESVQINLERGDRHLEPAIPTLSKNVEFVNVHQGFGE